MRWNFGGTAGHQRFMSIRLALSVLLALSAPPTIAASPERPPAQAAIDARELDIGGGRVRVEVVGVAARPRADDLHRWLAECLEATLTAHGHFPLSRARVRIEQQPSRDPSPVPWGQTLRRDGVAVLLYVREDASLDELREDWTAVHELSHLFHPYLGREGRWLAEGLASYYQNVLRARAGLMAQDQAWRRLHAGFGRGRRENSGLPLRDISRRHRGTMRVYWAGAAFWLEADLALRTRGRSLDAVLAQYGRCCLRGTGEVSPEAFIAQLDRIAGGDTFAGLYARYVDSTTFPSLAPAYAALGLSPDDENGLRLSSQPAARALRRSITGRRDAR